MAGLSILLLAIGAVLAFAVNVAVEGLDLTAVGVILMIVGAIGLIVSVVRSGGIGGSRTRTERVVSDDGRQVVEERRRSSL